ncbi:type VI secretion system Vgr family protein [Acanthopleuribacter pedis]|uniref:Type VI secretion system tip protein VgrG n=1 Tax=Acanthopleuribacter pedis TaxID=442870 RepID=A0A8J7U3F2_9BACT|nr:type VI secretion system tip protein TssI/VgrG [Acanthopleuribacter pedis]MBO1318283.1 type VI secretion system tip protein VgrG [Acanthopleuribacter pedis]
MTKENDLNISGLGEDFWVLHLEHQEEMNQPFTMIVDVVCRDPSVHPRTMLGKAVTVEVTCGPQDQHTRQLSGMVTDWKFQKRFHGNAAHTDEDHFQYRAVVRPSHALLSEKRGYKVWQNMTVKDMVSSILQSHGVSARWELTNELPDRTYIVQYDEPDLNFVHRQLEAEGAYYFYDHERGELVFQNSHQKHPACVPIAQAPFRDEDDHDSAYTADETVFHAYLESRIIPAKYVAHGYNYETPDLPMIAERSSRQYGAQVAGEVYESGHLFSSPADIDKYTFLMRERAECFSEVLKGSATCRSFAVGHVFDLQDHYSEELNQKWLIYKVKIQAKEVNYRVDFEAIPVSRPYRPAPITPKPKIHGYQTAVIAGKPGIPVFLDDMGRCKIRFHWDREGPRGELSSKWVRRASGYAGQGFGFQHPPHVGQEVLVAFNNGNPDDPIVVGAVYNAVQKNPLGPAQKHQTILNTISGHTLRMDDTAGEQKVSFESSRDLDTIVEHNAAEAVKNIKSTTVKGNYTIISEEGQFSVTADKQGVSLKCDTSKVVLTNESVTLSHGDNSITINENGVQVKGTLIELN